MDQENEHIIEVAKAKVCVRNGVVTVLSEPLIKYCPTWERVLGLSSDLNKNTVKEIIERRIKIAKLFDPERMIESDKLIFSFGASELLYCGISCGVIDAAIIVCDGAGTVVIDNPKIVQGIGGWMSGIIKTSPISGIIERLKAHGVIVVDESTARIDPIAGVTKAIDNGYKNIAITIAERDISTIPVIRDIESKSGCNVTILSVCTGPISNKDAEILTKADLIWSCASKSINEVVAPKSIFTTRKIKPIYAPTEKGKSLILCGVSCYSNIMNLSMQDEPMNQPSPLI